MQLSARSGPQAGQRFSAAKPETTIGRSSDNDIVLKDPLVSRHHARIRREGEGYVLEDLGSANGTILNGTPLAALQRLQPGDEIRIGGTGLVVEMAEQRPAAVRRAPAASGWLVAVIGAVGLLFVALLVVIAILLVQPRDEDGQTLRSAPALLQPANGASFRGTFTPVVLRWAEADGGTANGPYRVVIQYTTSGEPRSLEQWVDAPSFEVPTELRERNSGDRFQWQVTAMRQTGSNADGSPAGEPVSQASETRFFTWTSGGVILATTTATAALQPAQTPTPTPRLTPVPTPPLAAPATPTATDVPLPTMVPTRADTPTARPDTPTPTEAPTLLPPPTPTSRPSPTPTRLVGQTPAPTATPTQVLIAPRTPTPTPTFISPPTPTPTRSFTPVPPTSTPTLVPPPTPTPTRRPSATPSPVPSPTPTFFVPPTPTPTRPPATATPTPTTEIFTSPTPPQTPWPTPQPPSG